MTAPIRRNIGKVFETMRDAMVDFFFIGISLVVGFADTLCDDFRVALAMASVFTILALHPSGILEELSTERTTHNVVELLSNEFVSLFLVDFFFPLTNRTLPIQTNIEWPAILQLFGCIELDEVYQSKHGLLTYQS